MAALTGRIDGPLAGVLAKNREPLNARFAAAAASGKRVEPSEFGEHLVCNVAPAVAAVHALDPGSSEAAGLALCELSLELFAGDLLGSKSRVPAVADGWNVLLPRYARLVRIAPRRVAGAVTNALTSLAPFTQTGCAEWIRTMAAASLEGSIEDVEVFLSAGRVAAWRAGAAHLRSSALDAVASLPAKLVGTMFGIGKPDEAPAVILRMRTDPWLDPAAPDRERALALVKEVGSFRGFGGSFVSPPAVSAVGDHLVVTSSGRSWELHADRFGATLLPVEAAPATITLGSLVDERGHVRLGSQEANLPALSSPTSAAVAGGTLAVTLRYSHAVFVFGAVS